MRFGKVAGLMRVKQAIFAASCCDATCRYHMMMEAFGGQSYDVNSSGSLAAACRIAFSQRRPSVINVQIDPMAGVESGNVHSFNAPKAKM